MKKKVLAALLAVCMILSTCVLYASAEDKVLFAQNSYVEKVDTSKEPAVNNLKKAPKTKYDVELTVNTKSGISLPKGITSISDNLMDQVIEFKDGSTPKKWTELKEYFSTEVNKIEGDTITITFKHTDANSPSGVYRVTEAIKDTDTAVASKLQEVGCVYNIKEADLTKTATVAKWTYNLYSFETGVRFFGATYPNLVASEIAQVRIFVSRPVIENGTFKTNSEGEIVYKTTSSVANKISDLKNGDLVEVVTYLKDKKNETFYNFNCWARGDEIVSYGEKTTLQKLVDSKDAAYGCFASEKDRDRTAYTYSFKVTGTDKIYANYVEIVDRHTITYSCGDGGKIVYAEGNDKSIENRDVFKGEGQVSVLHQKKAWFTFTPDDGYEVAHVYVDGKDVTSFLSLIDRNENQSLFDALQELIKAGTVTTKDVKASGTYTFKEVDQDHTIKVVFQAAQSITAPTEDKSTVAAEGITLATGADAENGDGENGATTVPAEDGAAANGGSAASGVVNPATGSTGAIAVFATLSVAACAAFVTAKKKED